ncbi:MAG: hypothetical protein A2284_16785 [Deltaproteobacteria bacterium RIFOXYA12_FULL_61_11]|nr:MAG: hypothetical protein A2284_16785 [Deltaproteobacteria bacterium RIFOXYA12_FULL_61_11]
MWRNYLLVLFLSAAGACGSVPGEDEELGSPWSYPGSGPLFQQRNPTEPQPTIMQPTYEDQGEQSEAATLNPSRVSVPAADLPRAPQPQARALPTAPVVAEETPPAAVGSNLDEDVLFDLINQHRASRGLSSLRHDPKLQQLARWHSADMAERRFFEHVAYETLLQRLEALELEVGRLTENIGSHNDVRLVFAMFLQSAQHHANILEPSANAVGVGVASAGGNAKMVTLNFGTVY